MSYSVISAAARQRNGACIAATVLLTVTAALSGCSLLPHPRLPTLHRDTPGPGPENVACSRSTTWWHKYQDAQLDRLIALALLNSREPQSPNTPVLSKELSGGPKYLVLRPRPTDLYGPSQNDDNVATAGKSTSSILSAIIQADRNARAQLRAAVGGTDGEAPSTQADPITATDDIPYKVASAYLQWQAIQAELLVTRDAILRASALRDLTDLHLHAGLEDPRHLERANIQLAEQHREESDLVGAASLELDELAALTGMSSSQLSFLESHALPLAPTVTPMNAHLPYLPDAGTDALVVPVKKNSELDTTARVAPVTPNPGPYLERPQLDVENPAVRLAGSPPMRTDAQYDIAKRTLILQQLGAERTHQEQELTKREVAMKRAEGLDDSQAWADSKLQFDQQSNALLHLEAQILMADLDLAVALGSSPCSDKLVKN